jgi:hypothetical protein
MRAERDQAEKDQSRQTKKALAVQKPLTQAAKDYLRRCSEDPKISPTELAGIAALLRDNPEVAQVAITKSLQSAQAVAAAHLAGHIKAAQIAFTEKAATYAELHLKATRAAYAAGEFDTAARHAEWAMEKIGTKNLRLIEMPEGGGKSGQGGPSIMVGVKIGGQQPVVIDADPE